MEEMVLLQLMQGFFNARGHGFRQRRKSEQKNRVKFLRWKNFTSLHNCCKTILKQAQWN